MKKENVVWLAARNHEPKKMWITPIKSWGPVSIVMQNVIPLKVYRYEIVWPWNLVSMFVEHIDFFEIKKIVAMYMIKFR